MRRLIYLFAYILTALAAPVSAATEAYNVGEQGSESTYVSPTQALVEQAAVAAYGPFRVLDEKTAALVGATDALSPGAFRAMMNAHPDIATLTFVECPGTYDDQANLALGRLIRAAGLAAIVPDGGSVRSGAVELVLAGTRVSIEDGAEFAVHAWEDQDGHEATEYAADSVENLKYLAYYNEMGMSPSVAAAFYAMTNSVPFADPLWLDGAHMRDWVVSPPQDWQSGPATEVRLAYLDLGLDLDLLPTLN
jgi:hypothetical protein